MKEVDHFANALVLSHFNLPNFHLVHPIVFGNVTQTHDANFKWGIIAQLHP